MVIVVRMSIKPRTARVTRALRRFVAVAGTTAVAATLLIAQPSVASAQDLAVGSSQVREDAWNLRNNLHSQADQALGGDANIAAKNAVDGAVNGLFPGLAAQKAAEAEAQRQAAEAQRRAAEAQAVEAQRANFNYGPCPRTARACVDLNGERAWIQENGVIKGGAAPISSGAPGYETPRGSFRVTRKVKDEISREYDNAPMPYSVYFTNNGHAFHEGSTRLLSHGCIHLEHADALNFWNNLKVGDSVFIY